MRNTIRKAHDLVVAAMKAHKKGLPLNDQGQLVPDPIPMAPPVGFKPSPSMTDLIRQQVLAVSREAQRAGYDSLDDADDFDVGDDQEIQSPYELDEESEVPIRVLQARAEQAQNEYIQAKRDAGLRMQDDGAFAPPSPQPTEKPAQRPQKPPEGAS